MGLREKKKARTKQAILMNAHKLLSAKDYNEITMDEIAEASDIAVGTLYNYFRSKGDLLLSLINESDDDYLMEARNLIRDSDAPAESRLTDLMVLASEFCVDRLSKSTWRHVSAAALANADSDMGRMYAETSEKHLAMVIDLMRRLKVSGEIGAEVDADAAAMTIFSMKSKMFLDFVSDVPMTLEQHRAQVRQGVHFFLHGIAP